MLFLFACEPASVDLHAPESASDLAELCQEAEAEDHSETIDFPAWNDGCAWGEGGNEAENDAHFSARREEEYVVELPSDAAVCDFTLDFAGPDGGASTPMIYDDNFVFTFNGIILATSYAPMLDLMPEVDGYKVWDWDSLVGTELSFDSGIPSWCLGEDTDESDCTIPLPETEGSMTLSFGEQIVEDLAFSAYEAGEYRFAFITLGDNDATDCSHEDFTFTVDVPYIEI